MKQSLTLFRTTLLIVSAFGIAIPVFGQVAPAGSTTLPDFDIRDSVRFAVKPTVLRHRAALYAFLAEERATKPELRLVAAANGLPKLLRRDGKALNGPSNSDPETNARNFLRDNSAILPFTAAEFDNLRLIVNDVTRDAVYLSFNQTLNGIDVFNAHIKVTLSKSGEIVQVAMGDVIPGLSAGTSPKLTHEEAVRVALRASGNKSLLAALNPIEVSDHAATYRNPVRSKFNPLKSELVLFPMEADSARLAYHVIAEVDVQGWYELVVDAETGALLFRHNLCTPNSARRGFGRTRPWSAAVSSSTCPTVGFPRHPTLQAAPAG